MNNNSAKKIESFIKEAIKEKQPNKKIKNNEVNVLAALGAIFAVFGVFLPNTITPTLAYLCLLALILKKN